MQHKLQGSRLDFICRFIAVFLMLTPLLAGSLLTSRAAQSNPAKPDFAAIDSYIQASMQENHVPGLALAIVQDNQVLYLKGFGQASADGKPVTTQAAFSIGSLTKAFTGLAIMQLVEAGKLELDAPVKRYLPWFKLADQATADRITLRHLLTHVSGLPRDFPMPDLTWQSYSPDKLQAGLSKLATVELEQAVGTYSYSNVAYQILAAVIQQASGQSYETYISQHIFAPLHMTQSFASFAEVPAAQLVTGHNYWFGQPVATPGTPPYRVGPGNGGLFSSAEDMAHFLIANLNGGRYNTASVLSANGIAELHKPAVARPKEGGYYAMGWDVLTTNGQTTLVHTGLSYNYLAKMLVIPERRLGIAVLQNSQYNAKLLVGDLNQDRIADGVASLLAGEKPAAQTASPWLWVIYGGIGLALVWQLVGVLRSVLKFRRWANNRPAGKGVLFWQVWLPFGLNLLWALFTLGGLFLLFGDIVESAYQRPDITYGLLASGLLALLWGIIRTVWAFLALRKPKTADLVGRPALRV